MSTEQPVSDTPETDFLSERLRPQSWQTSYTLMRDFARTLERQRDEARGELEDVNRKWQADHAIFRGALQLLKEANISPDSTQLIAACERFDALTKYTEPNKPSAWAMAAAKETTTFSDMHSWTETEKLADILEDAQVIERHAEPEFAKLREELATYKKYWAEGQDNLHRAERELGSAQDVISDLRKDKERLDSVESEAITWKTLKRGFESDDEVGELVVSWKTNDPLRVILDKILAARTKEAQP